MDIQKYKAICADHHDPLMRGRIRVYCQPLYGALISGWAEPCLSAGTFFVPAEGMPVWVELIDEDTFVWTGIAVEETGAWQQAHSSPTKNPRTGAIVDKDYLEHAQHPADHAEHKAHGMHAPYYEPYISGIHSVEGHAVYMSDEPGNQYITLETANGEVDVQYDVIEEPGGVYGKASIAVKSTVPMTMELNGKTKQGKLVIGGMTVLVTENDVTITGIGSLKAMKEKLDSL